MKKKSGPKTYSTNKLLMESGFCLNKSLYPLTEMWVKNGISFILERNARITLAKFIDLIADKAAETTRSQIRGELYNIQVNVHGLKHS